jgi:hypothetical protein
MKMRSIAARVTIVLFFVALWCPPANGDGGTVRLSATRSGYLITVFSSPAPFRAGPVDISVLVQDASTGEPLADTRVTIRMTQGALEPLESPATHEVATNKLLHAAEFELPVPGPWQLQVRVDGSHGTAVVGCEVEAADPLPPLFEMWPWISAPVVAIALFGAYQLLTKHRQKRMESVNKGWRVNLP